MTTLTATAPAKGRRHGHFGNIVAAELTKFRSVRSSYWSLIAAAVLTIGIGALTSMAIAGAYSSMGPGEQAAISGTEISLLGLWLGQLVIGALGVLAMTSEYSTGLIRTTLAAVPHRSMLLMAKATIVGGIAAVSGVALSLTSFLVGQVLLGPDLAASLGDPGVARVVVGAGVFVGVVAVVGLAVGAVVRHTAGAIVALVGVTLVLPTIVDALPKPWSNVREWMLSSAGEALMTVDRSPEILSPGRGALVALLWVVGSLALAAVVISRRDA
jgi:ABC-2 type transport system permease protein